LFSEKVFLLPYTFCGWSARGETVFLRSEAPGGQPGPIAKKKQGAENFSAPCPMLGQDGVGPDTIFSGF
jgi:hypothetical protein